MPRATLNGGIELEYDVVGSADGTPLLLVMGFTAQLIAWQDGFCEQLAKHGFRVIRFDNRDCGLSTKFDGVSVDIGLVLEAALGGQPDKLPQLPYTLSDMAADAVGLLDHLGIDRAHIAGASMGGMIVQQMAIEHPTRVRSMTSIMSTTGEPGFGSPMPEAAQVLLAPPPEGRDDYVESSVKYSVWQSKRWFDPVEVKALAARSYDRSFYPEGAQRQLGAIYATGSRAAGLAKLEVPTLVIHGRDDTLIAPSGGERTAELVPRSSLLMLADMGHDIPQPLWPTVTGAIAAHAKLADA
ncbi:MAG: alpha/beta hydrolase [Actinomycetota bacterium]|nr:MAG: alpha/beta hydrolase [Actinomycetota bacterium]